MMSVDDGKAESVSAYVAEALRHYGRSVTLRELLDEWWAADPAGLPSDADRTAARTELGLHGDQAIWTGRRQQSATPGRGG